MIQFCNIKKKDLEVIINKISDVGKLKDAVIGDWNKCLKKRAKRNPDDIKVKIFNSRLEINTLAFEVLELENEFNLNECESYSRFIKSEIVQGLYGSCKKDESIIKLKWTSIKNDLIKTRNL